MGVNLTILKMSPDTFIGQYTESVAAQTDHYVDNFSCDSVARIKCCDDVMTLGNLTLTSFYFEKTIVRKKYLKF